MTSTKFRGKGTGRPASCSPRRTIAQDALEFGRHANPDLSVVIRAKEQPNVFGH
jgi:hypothetical protein